MFEPTFRFKQFGVSDSRSGLKVGTDGVLLGAWADVAGARSVLDAGAGCGLIALMVAQRNPEARITGVDINPGAVEDMRENVAESPWADRIETVLGDYRNITGEFDLIVSNPPFFTNGELAPEASRAAARHAGRLSPLTLPAFAAMHLAENGRLAFIAPSELDEAVETEAALARLWVERCDHVSTSPRRGVTRTLWQLTRNACPLPSSQLIEIKGESYQRLTRDFYL